MTRVLVTGAGGLIGEAACGALHAAGLDVIALHHTVAAPAPWVTMAADLLSDAADATLASTHPDVVVHCAAVLPASFGVAQEVDAAQSNRRMDRRIVDLVVRGRSKLVFVSSAAVYGAATLPWREERPAAPSGPYAEAKLATEGLIDARTRNGVSLRVSAPYGPRQRLRTVLRVFIESALADRDVTYHGDGAREQDFTADEDVARAVVAAVRSATARGVFNVASGKPMSMRALADLVVRSVPGSRSRVGPSGKPDPQEGFRAHVDIGKAARELGWAPTVPLEDGIARWLQSLRGVQSTRGMS